MGLCRGGGGEGGGGGGERLINISNATSNSTEDFCRTHSMGSEVEGARLTIAHAGQWLQDKGLGYLAEMIERQGFS